MAFNLVEKVSAMIYDCLAVKNHKSFARLNFPDKVYSDEVLSFVEELVSEHTIVTQVG